MRQGAARRHRTDGALERHPANGPTKIIQLAGSYLSAADRTGPSVAGARPVKNELLFRYDINFNDLPTWQRRGIGLWWETYQRPGHDPIRQIEVTATRRRITVDRDLPMKAAYRDLIQSRCANVRGAGKNRGPRH